MGNLISLDMGITMLRCTIFDKSGKLKKLLKEVKEEEKKEKATKLGDTLSNDGFTPALTVYSPFHQGTFYFLQFNIIRSTEVIHNWYLYSSLKVRPLRICAYS